MSAQPDVDCPNCGTPRHPDELDDCCMHDERENADLRAEVERLKAENARLLHTCHLSSGSSVVKCGRCAACLTSELNLRESALNSERLAHSATCRENERLKGQLRIETEAAVNEQGRAAHLEAENARLKTRLEILLAGGEGGLCQDPACAGHCGYGHLDGCAAVREWLSDNGGEKFRGVEGRTEAYRQLRDAVEFVTAAMEDNTLKYRLLKALETQ